MRGLRIEIQAVPYALGAPGVPSSRIPLQQPLPEREPAAPLVHELILGVEADQRDRAEAVRELDDQRHAVLAVRRPALDRDRRQLLQADAQAVGFLVLALFTRQRLV